MHRLELLETGDFMARHRKPSANAQPGYAKSNDGDLHQRALLTSRVR
jgi:hypothetical protein